MYNCQPALRWDATMTVINSPQKGAAKYCYTTGVTCVDNMHSTYCTYCLYTKDSYLSSEVYMLSIKQNTKICEVRMLMFA